MSQCSWATTKFLWLTCRHLRGIFNYELHLSSHLLYNLILKNRTKNSPATPLNFEQKKTWLCPFNKSEGEFWRNWRSCFFFQYKCGLENPQIKMLILCWCQHIKHDSLVDECLPVECIISLFSFMCCADLL